MRNFDLTLYLVTDSTGVSEESFLETIRQACLGGVTMIQLREKERCGSELYDLAKRVKDITDDHGIPLIIDDRADIASAVGAAGVHLGAKDIPIDVARRLLGPDSIIGATAKTVEQAMIAKGSGADYLGVGAIFPTTTKVVTVITKVETLNDIANATGMPVVAIGGLNCSNINVLYNSMADGIAVVSAIMKSDDPRSTAKLLKSMVIDNFVTIKNRPEVSLR